MGVRRNIIPWICDFLQNRLQCVRFNNTLSDDLQLTAGVPLGTKLGPIGFQILINDAAANAQYQYWKYVDDLTFAENTGGDHQGNLQNDLQHFSDWASSNGLNLNAKKCQALEVKFSNADKLEYVDKAKILWLWIQNDLKWQTQVDVMIKKANKRLFMLRPLKRFGFDQDELFIVYKSYVRPVVEYADVVRHSRLTCKHTGDIERIQRRACRTILDHQFTTYSESITRWNLIKLSDRRVDHCLSFAMELEVNPRTRHY